MGTQSDSPPSLVDDKLQNPAALQPAIEDQKDATAEVTKANSPTSVFVNSEPIREDQVQNAIKFLSHPRVRGSPVIHRRAFLERKGLTKEEIDEAFRRVPDPTPSTTATQPVMTNQDGQLKSSSNVQSQTPTQALQPAPVVPTGSSSKLGILSRLHWTHALLAVGLLAASGAGTALLLKNSVIPRLKSWIRKVVLEEDEDGVKKGDLKPSLAEEAAAAAKAAAAAAADVARASQEMLISKNEERRYFEELSSLLNTQVREIKSMSNALQKLEGQGNISGRIPIMEQDDHRFSISGSRSYVNGKVDADSRSVRSLSPPAPAEPSVAPHPKSYMEIMAMVQRGEKPGNIREINDLPPNPNQPVPNPRIAPKPKPWEVGQAQPGSVSDARSEGSNDGLSSDYLDNQFNGDSSVPWWQRRNVRITEIENDNEQRVGTSSILTSERPVQRSWVPPQPPPVAMPEAAAAIRQPKKPAFQKEQLTDDQLLGRSSGIPDDLRQIAKQSNASISDVAKNSTASISDELQRITKISESGGIDANGGSSGPSTSEIQNVDNNLYYEA